MFTATNFSAARLIALCAVTILCLTGCKADPTAANRIDRYDNDAQLLAMPSCQATVVRIFPCGASLVTEDGRGLSIGGPGAAGEVVGFVQTLEEGQTYVLPDAFLNHQKHQRSAAAE